MAELKPYKPTIRDRLAAMLMGDNPSSTREQFVQGLMGSRGIGSTGLGLADFSPAGPVFSAEEALREGDPQAAALAIMPIPGAAKAGKATKGLREAFENAPYAAAKHKHLAERYPVAGPPEVKLKDNPKFEGETYLAKKRTPEEDAMMKDRVKIQKDMDKYGYEPYFEPSLRADVNKEFYPDSQNTLTDSVAVGADTRAKHEALADTPENRERLIEAFRRGEKIPGAENWYWMKQLEDEYIKEYGAEEGRKQFKSRFAGGMAATTGGMDPMNNLMLSQYGAFNTTHGIPIPEAGHQIPSPMGGPYVYGNLKNYYRMNGPGGLDMDAIVNPKRHNFQYNFLGHEDKATIDEQMSELLQIPKGAPPSGNYGSYELPVHRVAAELGVEPRYAQEVMWAGGKQMKNEAKAAKKGKVLSNHEAGKPMIQFVNDAIERTHRLTGMPRAEIVRRALVRGEIPLYGTAGMATLAGMHGLNDEPTEY